MRTEKLVLRRRNLALLISIAIVVIGAIFSGAVSAIETPMASEATPAKTGIRKSAQVEYGKGLGPPEEIAGLQPQDEIMLAEAHDGDVDFGNVVIKETDLSLYFGTESHEFPIATAG